MKLNVILFRQRINFNFNKLWRAKGKQVLMDSGTIKILKAKGIRIYEPKEILNTEIKPQLIEEVSDYIPKEVKLDSTHPNWHEKLCFMYKDNNVLVEGLNQAKVITKTIEFQQGLPDQILIKDSNTVLNEKVKNIILNSHLFDAQQEKLPKCKDPERPAWNFPRSYGIVDSRVNKLLITKLLQLVELESAASIVKQRNILHDLHFWFPFEKGDDLFQFQLRGDTLVTTLKPLPPITTESTEEIDLPNLFPLKSTVSLPAENIYRIENVYPIERWIPKFHPHTIFAHYNATEVKNLYEEEVTENQFLGRSLMKAFVVAATYAKQNFGNDVTVLPKPITVQSVHTDGRIFHFGIFQLNSLDMNKESIKNIWYQTPRIALFNKCQYHLGKPILEGYNSSVIEHLLAFYNNE